MPISLIVHSGAGDDIHDGMVEPFRRGVIEAAQVAWTVLKNQGSALDAVEAAVRVMEDNPTFDAGRGSFPNQAGEIEMDAILMDGATLNNGAVAAIQHVAHPIQVARLVMERTPHTLLVGAGAEAFARSMGVPIIPTEALRVEGNDPPPSAGNSTGLFMPVQDTVGALALDAQGHLAAATSTGGMRNKMPGRVGDSPIIGSGAYADDRLGAASATGRGEDIMKIILSKSACDLMVGLAPQAAAEAIIRRLAERVQGQGGIILMNPRGEVGCAYNTLRMGRAWINQDGEIVAFV